MIFFPETIQEKGLRLFIRFMQKLPWKLALAAGGIAGRAAGFVHKRRRNAYADLKSAFGSRFSESGRWKIVRDHFSHLAQTGVEVIRFPLLSPEYLRSRIHWDHHERFEETLREDGGLILLTAHYGNWELLHLAAVETAGPVHFVQRPQKKAVLDRLLNEMRQIHGSRARGRGMGIRDLLRALRDGQVVALLGDQDAGRQDGVIVRLFGRKTTVPTGPFDLALRTGAILHPGFIVREAEGHHRVFALPPIGRIRTEQEKQQAIERYLQCLEDFAGRYPSQWLWAAKRWKYSWTKRLAVLSDGKPGHERQSRALCEQFRKVTHQYGREGMEYPVEVVPVRFRSPVHRHLFAVFAFFWIPFAQGRLKLLSLFFEPGCARRLRDLSADFIISAGAALVPLNLCLARENCAKSIVMMRPPFPYSLFRYDLALIPEYDRGRVPDETFRTLLTPGARDADSGRDEGRKIAAGLQAPERVQTAVFLGGRTRRYDLDLVAVEKLVTALERLPAEYGDYLLTTSRRTASPVTAFLKQAGLRMKRCQMRVLAGEDNRPEVPGGMRELARVLIVTEDSLSMISECVASGKPVILLRTSRHRDLPRKHRTFCARLIERGAVIPCAPEQLEEALEKTAAYEPVRFFEQQEQDLNRKLEAIL